MSVSTKGLYEKSIGDDEIVNVSVLMVGTQIHTCAKIQCTLYTPQNGVLLFINYFSNGKHQCTILDAWGWWTGTTQRGGMGMEEGGGFRMGNTCIPVVDSFWYLAKLIQYCKVFFFFFKKEVVVQIHNGIILIYEKEHKFESVLMRWMKLEPFIQSEVSHKEKHQYCILTHIYRI